MDLLSVRESGRRKAEDPRGDDVLLDLRGAAHHALGAAVEVDLQRDVVAVDHGIRSRHGERRGPHRLLDPRHQELVDGTTGTVVYSVETFGEPAADVES